MRVLRLTALALFASFALTACTSPTASNDDCETNPEFCGFPTTGN